MNQNKNKIFICYISGLDLRRINKDSTPFLFNALNTYPWAEVKNLPSNELFPTLVTGVDPAEHGVWGVKLKSGTQKPRLLNTLLDFLPDLITTTFQCTLHLLNNLFDLPAIPPKRRRKFEIMRTKYKRRSQRHEALSKIGGYDTIFDIAGKDNSHYLFDSSLNPTEKLSSELCNNKYNIEFLEIYSLDRYQQWNLHRPDKVISFYNVIDKFLESISKKCSENSTKLLIVSDHGHEPIKESINIVALLKNLQLPKESFSYFIEVSSIRLWFQNDLARNAVTTLLKNLKKGQLITYKNLPDYGISVKDNSYGEMFYYLDQGNIFFPHDFNQPIANLYFGLTDKMQLSRILNPQHKGNHGHLPGCEAEKAFVLLLDRNYKIDFSLPNILDIAPSILTLAGYDIPISMKGRSIFKEK